MGGEGTHFHEVMGGSRVREVRERGEGNPRSASFDEFLKVEGDFVG